MTDPQPFSQTWCNRTHLQAESRRKARGWSCGCSVCKGADLRTPPDPSLCLSDAAKEWRFREPIVDIAGDIPATEEVVVSYKIDKATEWTKLGTLQFPSQPTSKNPYLVKPKQPDLPVIINAIPKRGRPRALSDEVEQTIKEQAAQGSGARAIFRALAGAVSTATISRRLKELRKKEG